MPPESPLVVEPRRRSARIQNPTPNKLSLNDLLFVNAYLSNGHNATAAYCVAHPKAKRASARACAPAVLARPSVQAEIRLRMESSQAVSVDTLSACLLKYRQMAEADSNYEAAADISMKQAKLAGLLVDKQEHKDVSAESATPIRQLVDQALAPLPATESQPITGAG